MVDLGTAVPPAGFYVEVIGTRAGRLDPFSLRPGIKVQLAVNQYTSGGSIQGHSARNWTLVGATASQATLSSDGVLTALAPTSKPFSISADITVGGATRTTIQSFGISASTTTVSGFVLNDATNAGVKYVRVDIADSTGQIVGGAMTGDGGKFIARIPVGGSRLSLHRDSIPEDYYRQLRYNARDYAADAATCAIRLPTLASGRDTALPSSIRIMPRAGGGPPPPPPNCIGL
jgi:hypothetical protein